MSQSPSLRMELKPSLLLAVALAAVHLLALGATVTALDGWAALLVATGILVSLAGTLAEAFQRTVRSPRALELREDGRCAWRDGAGRWHEATLHSRRFVAPGLVVLALEGGRRRKWLALPPDASDRESLRRLRAWLRWRIDAARDPVADA
jgi:membrane-bound toxin of toxin-antitoxin system